MVSVRMTASPLALPAVMNARKNPMATATGPILISTSPGSLPAVVFCVVMSRVNHENQHLQMCNRHNNANSRDSLLIMRSRKVLRRCS